MGIYKRMTQKTKKKRKAKQKVEKRRYQRKAFQSARGMRDILPADYVYYEYVLQQAKKIFNFYGFKRMEPPILEKKELFIKGVGSNTEIIEKEMYILKTKGEGETLALRPEYTAGIVRSYVENGMFNWAQPVKLYSFGPVFRHEKPQAGRFRQFYQLNLEAIGEEDPVIDVEVILAAKAFLESLGFKSSQLRLKINSIGCSICRPGYIKALKKYYSKHLKDICVFCRKRFKDNPLRLLDCKNEKCQSFQEGAPFSLDYLCPDCREHFKKVLEVLDSLDVPYILDKTLVRGLDYYTKTVFEFFVVEEHKDEEGKINEEKTLALAGGGRYDDLIKTFGGPEKPAVGVAFGVERLISLLKKREKKIVLSQPSVFLVQIGDTAQRKALSILEEFRRENIVLAENLGKSSLRAQLKNADKLNVRYALILGQKEVLDGMIILRDMRSGVQELIPLTSVISVVKKYLRKNTISPYSKKNQNKK